MAQPIPCDSCTETEADLLVTFIANGDTLGLCIQCVPVWAEAITKAIDAEAAAAAPAAPADDDALAKDGPAPRPAARARKRPAKTRKPRGDLQAVPDAPGAAEGPENPEYREDRDGFAEPVAP